MYYNVIRNPNVSDKTFSTGTKTKNKIKFPIMFFWFWLSVRVKSFLFRHRVRGKSVFFTSCGCYLLYEVSNSVWTLTNLACFIGAIQNQNKINNKWKKKQLLLTTFEFEQGWMMEFKTIIKQHGKLLILPVSFLTL